MHYACITNMSGDNPFTKASANQCSSWSKSEYTQVFQIGQPHVLLDTSSTSDSASPISKNEESQPTKKFKSVNLQNVQLRYSSGLNPTIKTIAGYNCAICKRVQHLGLKVHVGGSWIENPFLDLNKLKERAAMHNSTTLHKQAASLTQPMIHVAIERLSRQNEWRDQIFLILEEKWNVLRHINHVFLLRRNYRVKYFCINSASICMSTL